MKYIKVISSGLVFGTDNLTTEDLACAKQGGYEAIINRITEEFYEPEENVWKPIISSEHKEE